MLSRAITVPYGAVTPRRFSQRALSTFSHFWETLVNVHVSSLGMRWGRYTVYGERSKAFGRKKFFQHAQNVFLGPTFDERLSRNVAKRLP